MVVSHVVRLARSDRAITADIADTQVKMSAKDNCDPAQVPTGAVLVCRQFVGLVGCGPR